LYNLACERVKKRVNKMWITSVLISNTSLPIFYCRK
jgi:hypothetical protein